MGDLRLAHKLTHDDQIYHTTFTRYCVNTKSKGWLALECRTERLTLYHQPLDSSSTLLSSFVVRFLVLLTTFEFIHYFDLSFRIFLCIEFVGVTHDVSF